MKIAIERYTIFEHHMVESIHRKALAGLRLVLSECEEGHLADIMHVEDCSFCWDKIHEAILHNSDSIYEDSVDATVRRALMINALTRLNDPLPTTGRLPAYDL